MIFPIQMLVNHDSREVHVVYQRGWQEESRKIAGAWFRRGYTAVVAECGAEYADCVLTWG